MKVIARQISPYFSKSALKPIGQVLGSQMLFQLMGFGIGIILVREMPKEDYAIYTVLMAVQGMLSVLASSGIMIGFRKIGGQIWDDNYKMSALVKTASLIRAHITILAFLIAGIYGTFLLVEQEIRISQISFFLICLLLIVAPEIYTSFIREALLLKKEVAKVQWMTIINQGIRLGLLIIVYLFFNQFLLINTVLCITIIGVWAAYGFIWKKSQHLIDKTASIIPAYKKTLIHYIKIIWHNVVFFAFQGQISIFLIGLFGTTDKLAELGALGRFSVIFTALTVLVSNIFAPKFGRTRKKNSLIRQYVQLIGLLAIISIVLFLIVSTFPDLFLWLLGSGYSQLTYELKLVIILGIINLFISALGYLNETKGWIKFRPTWEIPINIISLLVGIWLYDISSLEGVLYLSITGSLMNFLLSIANCLYGFRELKFY